MQRPHAADSLRRARCPVHHSLRKLTPG